ncbi:MAG TPA: hypothetical protein PLK82_01075 [Bacteroidales bacterium]|nr:hypothetical protein [Bacteroidales bacterium]
MKKFLILSILVAGLSFRAIAQQKENTAPAAEKKTPPVSLTFSGYINTDIFFDSRQTVMAREGQWLFFPENIRKDADGKDLNAKGSYNILNIQTRIRTNITGPDILGAKSTGLLEGEFYGSANASINSLRIRHAWVKLSWPKTELLVGQAWHPFYVPEAGPEVVSLNAGAPFLVFCRNPQVRVTQRLGNFYLAAAVLSQLDHTSTGPDGPSPKYLRNSVIPELVGQVRYAATVGKTEIIAGASIDFLMMTPRLTSDVVVRPAYDTVINSKVVHHDAVVASYKATEHSSALSYNVFAKVKFPRLSVKAGGVYTGNGYGFSMMGGYAGKSITDTARGLIDYATIRTLSLYGDVNTVGKRWSVGLFGAFCRNLGAGTEVIGPYYSRGANIDYLYRVAPRLVMTLNKLKVGLEVDYTVAAYGTIIGNGMVSNSKEVANIRALLGVFYYF